MQTGKKNDLTVISGGQTGVDRAALDVAMRLGIAHGGWCPAGRRAEDGSIPLQYPLRETGSRNYTVRTRRNVDDSDATLVLGCGEPAGGTRLTMEYAGVTGKPLLLLVLDEPPDRAQFSNWLGKHRIRVLNVAGPRESSRPGIYRAACVLLEGLLGDPGPSPTQRR